MSVELVTTKRLAELPEQHSPCDRMCNSLQSMSRPRSGPVAVVEGRQPLANPHNAPSAPASFCMPFFNSTATDSSSDPPSLPASISRLHYTNPLLVAGTTALVGGASFRLWARYLRRIPNADYITQEHLGKRRLRGVVTRSAVACGWSSWSMSLTESLPLLWLSVGDADNFRLFHKPLLSRPVPTSRSG